MEKKIYSRKYDFNSACIILTCILAFFWLFFLVVGFFAGMDSETIPLIIISTITLFYFLIHILVGIKMNKVEIYEDHIEVCLFKNFILRKYNIKKEEIDGYEILGFNCPIILKNGKKINLFSICESFGKGKYYEIRKFQNAMKKIGID